MRLGGGEETPTFTYTLCSAHLVGLSGSCLDSRMKSWLVGRLGLGLGVFGLVVACSASDSGSSVNGGGATGGSGGSGATGTGGSGNTGTGGFGNTGTGGGINTDGGGASGGSGGIEECAGETQTGELVPLDMYVMMDISGSMTGDAQGGGTTKWAAVKDAMKAFFDDSGSAGIGVGLQYFPLRKAGVPASCTSNAQCGDGAPCLLKTCAGLGVSQITPCTSNQQCPLGAQCDDLGQCSGDPDIYCYPIGGTACSQNGAGNCVAITSSFCVDATSCLVGDYAAPAVDIALLPGNAQALKASLDAQSPTGNTPTGPALQGAIDHATSYANANPDHRVITVMATDGLPTECAPTDIGQLANVAAGGVNGSPSISTFVIGVFSQSEAQQASSNLNQIAQAGSGRNAFIVDTAGNVTDQFKAALNDIRGSALACEFLLPEAPAGETLDYRKVNVLYNGNTVYYVESQAQCDPQSGGWYYDIPPGQGTPTKIVVCPSTCDEFKSTTGGSVDIKLGCVTEVVPR